MNFTCIKWTKKKLKWDYIIMYNRMWPKIYKNKNPVYLHIQWGHKNSGSINI